MTMKENDGQGARRELFRRLGMIAGAFGLLLIILVICRDHRHRKRRHHGGNGFFNAAHTDDGVVGHSSRERSRSFNKNRFTSLDKHGGGGGAIFGGGHHRSGGGGGSSHYEIDPGPLDLIVQGHLNLVELQAGRSGSTDDVYGVFCRVSWGKHKRDPTKVPMFRDLVNQSPDCESSNRRKMHLPTVLRAVRAYDAKQQQEYPNGGRPDDAVPKQLKLTAVAFHESRCGSTLFANIVAAVHPEQHRVYSESDPPVKALKRCGENFEHCSEEDAVELVRDVMYLMSRSDRPTEERVFFKIQSIGSLSIPTFLKAFPTTPWLYVFRDPVQVMMSHFPPGKSHQGGVCLRTHNHPTAAATRIALKFRDQHGLTTTRLQSWPDEMYCAAHLASLTETAATSLNDYAIPVHYEDMAAYMYKTVLPELLGVEMGPEQVNRVLEVSGQYSKGRGNRGGAFESDSRAKEKASTPEIRRAAQIFLTDSYQRLLQWETKVEAPLERI